MNKLFKNIFQGYLLALFIELITSIKMLYQMSSIEALKIIFFSSLILTPVMSLLVYAIKFAGIPLINDFIEGSTSNRILIVIIVITLVATKFFN